MADRFGYGEIGLDINPCRGCEDYDAPDGCKSNGGCGKPITNYDRLISKSPEELAAFLRGVAIQGGIELGGRLTTWLDWLKQEAKDS